MHCDRAQEFFSDYLERTLDRPMTAALEGHLSSCLLCREELEALQDTVLALDSVPEVNPPADGAWDVMRRLRNARAEQLEAERRKAPTFLEWLRSLNPLSVGMGASLATLIIGGTLMFTSMPGVKSGFVDFNHRKASAVPDTPAVQVSYGQVTPAGQQQVLIAVTPVIDLPEAQVRLEGASLPLNWEAKGSLARARRVDLPPVELSRASAAEAVRLTVDCPTLHKQYRYLLVVPLGERKAEPVTVFANNLPLEEGLRRVAPYLSRPVVVDGSLDGAVNLTYGEATARRCLDDLASQVNAKVSEDGTGVYRVVANTNR